MTTRTLDPILVGMNSCMIISGNWLDYAFEGEDAASIKLVVCLFGRAEPTQDVCTDPDRISDYLCKYRVTSLPWKIVLDENGNIVSSSELSVSSTVVEGNIAELFQEGITASNNDNYADAASW